MPAFFGAPAFNSFFNFLWFLAVAMAETTIYIELLKQKIWFIDTANTMLCFNTLNKFLAISRAHVLIIRNFRVMRTF